METFAPACPVHTPVNADMKLIDSQLQDFLCLFERGALQRARSLAWDTEHFLELFHLERAVWMYSETSLSTHQCQTSSKGEKETQGPFRSWGQMCCRDLARGNISSGWRMGVERNECTVPAVCAQACVWELKARISCWGKRHLPHLHLAWY